MTDGNGEKSLVVIDATLSLSLLRLGPLSTCYPKDEMRYFLYTAMKLATNASMWMIALLPSFMRCSKYAACFAVSCLSSTSSLRLSSRTNRLMMSSGVCSSR